jgi:hypothetical protein
VASCGGCRLSLAGRRPHWLLHVEWVSSSRIVATLAAGGPASCLLFQSQPSLAEGVWWAALSRGIPGSWVCRFADPRGGTLEMPRRPHSLIAAQVVLVQAGMGL